MGGSGWSVTGGPPTSVCLGLSSWAGQIVQGRALGPPAGGLRVAPTPCTLPGLPALPEAQLPTAPPAGTAPSSAEWGPRLLS